MAEPTSERSETDEGAIVRVVSPERFGRIVGRGGLTETGSAFMALDRLGPP